MRIRKAEIADRDRVAQLHRRAFDAGERESIARLASDLLDAQTNPEVFNWVAEAGDALVGHVAFSPVFNQARGTFVGYLLAPLAVAPEHQRTGLGTLLVEAGLTSLARRGVVVVLVYGDPSYYARFGFQTGPADRFVPPFELKYPAGWQVCFAADGPPPGAEGPIHCIAPLQRPELWS